MVAKSTRFVQFQYAKWYLLIEGVPSQPGPHPPRVDSLYFWPCKRVVVCHITQLLEPEPLLWTGVVLSHTFGAGPLTQLIGIEQTANKTLHRAVGGSFLVLSPTAINSCSTPNHHRATHQPEATFRSQVEAFWPYN